MSDDLTGASLGQLARLIEARKLSPCELVEASLARIERLDPAVAAFVEVTAEKARIEARTAESEIAGGHYRGPLHGIPFATKDIIDVAGLPTTCGSRLLAGNRAERDATCVSRLVAAGAISLGKAATYEFATGGPSFDLPWPPTRNPWNLDHGPGGSSTGSAAAVASGMVPLALGSDTGGSIRVPASYCGLTGLKPTFGRIGTAGVWPLAPTFDTVGLLCRSAEDAAIGLQALAGLDPADRTAAAVEIADYRAGLNGGLRGLRIGLVRHLYDGANAELIAAMDEAVAVLRGLGATVSEATLAELEDYGACAKTITGAEAFALHRQAFVDDPAIFGEMFRYRVLPGILVGFSKAGLPLSLQIVGRPFDEAGILRVAHAYQQETDWHQRRPPLDTPLPTPTTRMPDWTPAAVTADATIDRMIEACLDIHGIRLSDRQRLQLREGAETFHAMVARVRDQGGAGRDGL